jgi:hypothetical protein
MKRIGPFLSGQGRKCQKNKESGQMVLWHNIRYLDKMYL